MADGPPLPVRMRGTIAGPEGQVPLADATLVVSGAEPVTEVAREPFDLLLEGGERIRIEPAAGDALLILGEERSLRGAWSEVEGDPLARIFSDRAPGPHVSVKLRGRAARVGDPIEIVGDVIEHEAVDGPAAPRHAPARRISTVRATGLAFGPDAQKAIEKHCRNELAALRREARAPRKPVDWKRLALIAAIVAGIGVIAIAMISSRVVIADVISFVAAFSAAAYGWFEEDTGPAFRVATGRREPPDRTLTGGIATLALLGALVTTVVHVFAALTGDAIELGWIAPALSVLALVVSTFALSIGTRYPARIARLLVDASPHPPGLPDGAWGTSAGVVADPTPLTTTTVPSALARVTTDGEEQLAFVGTFVVQTEAGAIEVEPEGALWASRVTMSRTVAAKSVVEEVVPIGGSVAVAGRLRRSEGGGPLLAATGPESLVVFATAADQPALEALRAFLRARRRTLLILPAVAAAIVAVAALLLR